jgi:protein-tyrosine kinase
MSRIHDALKKAEQERAQATGTVAAPVPSVEAPIPATIPADDLAQETVPAVLPASVQTALAEMTGTEGVSSEDLRRKCRLAQWKPDCSTMLFFDRSNHNMVGAEEFRTLRSKLYQVRAKQELRTVLVSSALPGEGKSFIAANLAQVIVRQSGRRALLIDADLRWSRLHQYLGAPATPGLTEYLRGTANETEVMQHGPLDNLYFIAGGMQAQQPAELIGNGRLKTLLRKMAMVFDWVILDSPPIVPVSDASVMADMCDGLLMVVQADVTPLEMAQKARQEMQNKPVLGVVLNKVEAKRSYSSYYYYSGGYGTEHKKQREKGN